MSHIFISYSHKDSAYAHELAIALEKNGVVVWIDDRIENGTQWPHVIEEKLNECSALIVIMTPRSYQSEWVQNELVYARHIRKPVFPLLLEGDVWLSVAATQYVDVTGGKLPPKSFFERISSVSAKPQGRPIPQQSKNMLLEEKCSQIVKALEEYRIGMIKEPYNHKKLLVGNIAVEYSNIPWIWLKTYFKRDENNEHYFSGFISQSDLKPYSQKKLIDLRWIEQPSRLLAQGLIMAWPPKTELSSITSDLMNSNQELGILPSSITITLKNVMFIVTKQKE